MTRTTRDTKTRPALKSDYDIAIVGAGAAGVAAAAGARNAADAAGKSATIILLDASARFGGSVTAAMHRSMCGLYSREPTGPLDTLNDGVQRDVIRRMVEKDPTRVVPRNMGKAWVLEFLGALWEKTLDEICEESKADVRMGYLVSDIQHEGNRIMEIRASPVSVDEGDPAARFRAKFVIDCTGGGHVLKRAGQDTYEPPDERMLGGYSIRIAGIPGETEPLRLQIPFFLAHAVEKGLLPTNARFTSFYPGPTTGEGICKLAINVSESTSGDAIELANRVIEYLRAQIPALSSAAIADRSGSILPRDGCRLRGRYTLTEADVLESRQFGTGSVHAWWPIEWWDPAGGPTYSYPEIGRPYDIPPDALRSRIVDNLLAAGTCLSATATAAASSRASGICLATGDAAGRLAVSLLSSAQLSDGS
jgi:2-polyprenyl-6-methoxyphenol hydroxylase-like FAD-dependent oxidoreductase